MTNIDFDEWALLYRTDPAAFDIKRKEILNAEILKAPYHIQPNLRILQDACDALSDNLPPLEATYEMSKLLVTQLGKLQTNIDNLKYLCK